MQTAGPVFHGVLGSIGTTALQLTTNASPLNTGIRIKALAGNTNKVYVGLVGVTTATGYELSAGNDVQVPCKDASTIYVIGGAAGQEVRFIAS
jgi:hypothetical protein